VHDLDERLERAVGELRVPVETTGVVERVRARVARHERRRLLTTRAALVAAVAAAALVVTQLAPSRDASRDRLVVGPRPTPTTSTPPPSTTTPAPDPSATVLLQAADAWPAFVATLPADTVASSVVESAEGPVAATGGKVPALNLYRFSGGAWSQVARFETVLALVFDSAGHFVTTDVTGDGQADFLALDFPGADHVGGVVLSAHGGRWHLVGFGGPGTCVTWLGLEDASFRAQYGSVVVTLENDCTPDCADGTFYQHHWRFDPATATFVSVARRVWPDSVADRLYSAWQQRDRAAASRVAGASAVAALFARDPGSTGPWDLYGTCSATPGAAAQSSCTAYSAYTQPGLTLEIITSVVDSHPLVTEVRFIER